LWLFRADSQSKPCPWELRVPDTVVCRRGTVNATVFPATSMWFQASIIFLLLVGSAFCSGSETALFSLDATQRARLRKGGANSALVLRHLDRPHRTLATLLLANMVLNVVISVLITAVSLDLWGPGALAAAVAVTTVLLVLFGEIIPKTIGLRRGRTFALLAAPTVELLAVVLAPFRVLVERLTTVLTPAPKEMPLDLAQLRTLVRASRKAQEITPFEAKVLQRTLSFGELTVERVLTPRVDLISIEARESLAEAVRVCRAAGRSRLVVTDGGIDHVVGVLLLKDLLPRRTRLDDLDVRSVMREPIFVPETLPAAKLFEQLQKSRMHLAIVVGEHGGVEGIATLEDVLEELIGDIRDESDLPTSELEEIDDGVWQADARIELDDLNDATGLALEGESDSITLSGWLEDHLGRIPRAGDEVELEEFALRVLTARQTRAHLVRVARSGEGA